MSGTKQYCLRDRASETDAGSLLIKGEHTATIEFRLREPTGMHKRCFCNDCELVFYIAPFAGAVECPRCNSRRVGSRRSIQSDCTGNDCEIGTEMNDE